MIGSIFVSETTSRNKLNKYYGLRDGTGSHAHVVFKECPIYGGLYLEHWRGISGLNPVIEAGSIFFHTS